MSNIQFTADKVNSEIENYTITITNNIIESIKNGFVINNKYCSLSIMSLLQHSLDNFILFDKEQFNKILYIYNKIVNE